VNLTELRTELYARGTDYFDEDAAGVTRATAFLNQAYRRILNAQPWVFLEDTATGTAPLTIADLRRVKWVRHATTFAPLKREDETELVSEGVDLSYEGVPQFYYLTSPTVIATVPTNGDSIEVKYIKRVDALSDGADEPVFDEEYHNLIVDGAMIKAYIDQDNYEAAQALKGEFAEVLAAMREDYVLVSPEPQYIRVVDPYDG
jgi:hypothetical protein